MTHVMASLFIDVHPSKAPVTLCLNGNCILIASTVGEYSLWQVLLRVLADSSTSPLSNAIYDCHSSRFHIVFHGIWAETNPNMRYRFPVAWWTSAVRYCWDPWLECFVCRCSQYRYDFNVEYEFPLWPYYSNSSTTLSLQYGQSCFINSWSGQFSNFRLC